MTKVLILRLSSLGDVIQCLSATKALKSTLPGSKIHFLTKSEFAPLVETVESVDKTHSLPKLPPHRLFFYFYKLLRDGCYTHVYDAHSNLRSHIFQMALRCLQVVHPVKNFGVRFVRRPKNRLQRFLFFKLGWNLFPNPFFARQSYLEPLKKWKVPSIDPGPLSHRAPAQKSGQIIALAPSAAWPMKTWPQGHYSRLIEALPDHNFVILGGPHDEFCQNYEDQFPNRVINLAGKLSIKESLEQVSRSSALVSGDTGLLHWADATGTPALALLGPTAFGRPWAATSVILESNLPCQPCTKDGRGKCSQKIYQRCLVEISPERVARTLRQILSKRSGEVQA